MKYITKLKLAAIHLYCDVNNKSTEYMIQFMQDSCKVDLDCVMNYFRLKNTEHLQLFKELNELNEIVITLTETY